MWIFLSFFLILFNGLLKILEEILNLDFEYFCVVYFFNVTMYYLLNDHISINTFS
jgi:hypothetical protein